MSNYDYLDANNTNPYFSSFYSSDAITEECFAKICFKSASFSSNQSTFLKLAKQTKLTKLIN